MADRTTLESVKAILDKATCPEHVFGALPGDKLAALHQEYRATIRTLHPDLATPADRELATDLLRRYNSWNEQAEAKIHAATYGDYKPYVPAKIIRPYTATDLMIGRKKLTLTAKLGVGTFSTVHRAEYNGDTARTVFLKIANDPSYNDLLEREFKTLKLLHSPADDAELEKFCAVQRICVPFPVATFFVNGDKGKHRANLLSLPLGPVYTAQQLREDVFRGPVPDRHVWWIIRRVWLTLWMAHLRGIVHGSVTPDNVLIYPDIGSDGIASPNQHMTALIDWTMSTSLGKDNVPAIDPSWKDFYAPEVFDKKLSSVQMDVFSAGSTALYMLLGREFRNGIATIPPGTPLGPASMLMTCADHIVRHRPHSAHKLYNDFGTLLGKREFVPLIIPKGG